MKIGYRRVSTKDQIPDRQLEGMQFDALYTDFSSGRKKDRPELNKILSSIQEGDHLYVHSLDRLARNVRDMLSIVSSLVDKGISITFHKESLTFSNKVSNPIANLTLTIFGAIAEWERAIIVDRINEGIKVARSKGAYPCKYETLLPEMRKLHQEGVKRSEIGRRLGIKRSMVYWLLEKRPTPMAGPLDQIERPGTADTP